jgi:transcriptional regulator with XRE-family HTH domain
MPDSGTFGSVRGVFGNGHPYRTNALAGITGMQQRTLDRLFKSEVSPTLDTLDELANSLGLSISDLLSSESEDVLSETQRSRPQSVSRDLAIQIAHVVECFLALPDKERDRFVRQLRHQVSKA